MKITNVKKYDVSSGDVKTLTFNTNAKGDVVTSEVYIQTLSDIPVTVTGYVDSDEKSFDMKALNVGTFKVVDEITEEGTYLVMAGSLQSLKLEFNGTGSVIVKSVY